MLRSQGRTLIFQLRLPAQRMAAEGRASALPLAGVIGRAARVQTMQSTAMAQMPAVLLTARCRQQSGSEAVFSAKLRAHSIRTLTVPAMMGRLCCRQQRDAGHTLAPVVQLAGPVGATQEAQLLAEQTHAQTVLQAQAAKGLLVWEVALLLPRALQPPWVCLQRSRH